MANKINFITGETYSLSELFSGERRIIVPDLQRDYCWGDENNTKSTGERGELVTDFVNNLLDQFDEQQRSNNDNSTLNLGLFYGYEVPADHIQLCDGQQRLTTLYLLLGMINKQTSKFRQHLISDFEYKHDDKEPYLNYAIRESSLYFLSDLVCKFFIDNNDTVDQIKSSDWYFDDYNLDPSIQSVLKALGKIEKILSEKDTDLLKFGDWLLNKVTFLYFDMENRKNGEETFVVINTTGEALSATQNLKPLVLQEKNDAFDNTTFNDGENSIDRCWEEIETWFWKNRNKDENDTADAGFAEFFRWISIIEQVDISAPEEEKITSITKLIQLILQGKKCDFPYKKVSFAKIYNYWKALKWIKEDSQLTFVQDYLSPCIKVDVNNRNAIGQNDCFVLLPVLKYAYQSISNNEPAGNRKRKTKRIYEFFKNLIRISNVSKAVNNLVGDAIKLIDLLKDGDLVSLNDSSVDTSAISAQILTKEEKIKLEIFAQSGKRIEVEDTFWKAQEHPIWKGEILPMINWATKEDGKFDFDRFKDYNNKFTEVFKGECDSNIDIVRRALLTIELNSYPRIFKGNTNYSFCWDWEDWHVLINDNKEKFKSFFDSLLEGIRLEKKLEMMIDCYNEENNVFYRFVKRPELLEYCGQKNIQIKENSYFLVEKQRACEKKYVELEIYCLYLEFRDKSDWSMQCSESTLVFKKGKVTIDVCFNRKKADDWEVQVYLDDKTGDKNAETELKNIADSCQLIWNCEKYEKKELSKITAVDIINKILTDYPQSIQ